MKYTTITATALLAAGSAMLDSAALAAESKAAEPKIDMIARGRYVATIGGCNDCHTPDYAMKNGEVPESLWLTGDALGWKGPWGTTYATNLRIHLAGMTEDQWVQHARTLKARPPMPWFNLRKMEEQDLRAFYRYVRSLGSPGKPAPSYVAPDKQPMGPVVMFPAPPK
jgi:mono/diheme cytochrome c family protein